MAEPLMTPHDLAVVLGITDGAMAMRIKRGKCPRRIKLGRMVRFDPAEARAWIEAQKERAPRLRLVPDSGALGRAS